MTEPDSYFRLGEWLVKPAEKSFECGDIRNVVEPRAMDVLTYMVDRPNSIVTSEELLTECWAGTFYGDNPVHKVIAQLRKALKDKASKPTYIETIRKRGYRLIAPISFPDSDHRTRVLTQTTWSSGSPYLGLEAFDSSHANIFFGRGEAIAVLLKRIKNQLHAGMPFVLTLGPSGSGKTSLIRAGILPLLTNDHGVDDIKAISTSTMTIGSQQTNDPVISLVNALLQWEVNGKSVYAPTDHDRIYDQVCSGQFKKLLEPIERTINHYRMVNHSQETAETILIITVDQFEKLCTNPDIHKKQTGRFLDALKSLVQSRHVLVLAAARNDFYPEIMQLQHVTELKSGHGQFDLLPPTSGEISEMIRKPAQAAGLAFEKDKDSLIRLDDQIRDDAINHPDILPLLQYTLNELYLHRDEDNCLCFAPYREMGGLQGALSKKAEAIINELDQAAQDRLDTLLGRLVILRTDDSVSSRSIDWHQMSDDHELKLVQTMIDARLLTSEMAGDRQTISVTHEALFVHWSRARQWIEKNQAILSSYSKLSAAAKRWRDESFSKDYLLGDGKPIQEAKLLSHHTQLQLEPNDKRFIAASLKRAGRRSGLRRLAIGTITVFAVLAAISGLIANDARKAAEQRQVQAEGLVGFMLGDLMDRLRPLGRLNLLGVVGDEAMRYLESLPAEDVGMETSLMRADALMQIGEIRLNQADAQNARSAFSEASDILDNLIMQRPAHGPTLLQAGNAKYWLGYLSYSESNLSDATEKWKGYKDYAEQWVGIEPNNQDAKMELSYAWNNLGTLAVRNGELDLATEYFEVSTGLKQQVLNTKPDDIPLSIELADSLTWIASTAQSAGQSEKAELYYRQGLDLLNSLYAKARDDNQILYRLIIAKQHFGQFTYTTGNTLEAIDTFQSAAEQFESLILIDPSNKAWQKDYAYLLTRLAWANRTAHEYELAEEQLSRARELLQQLTSTNEKHVEWHRSYLNAQYKLAQTKKLLNQHDLAHELLYDAYTQLDIMYTNNNDDLLTRTLLAEVLISMGEWQCSNDKAAARTLWSRSVAMLEPVAIDSKETRVLAPLLMGKTNLNQDTSSIIQLLDEIGYQPSTLEYYINKKQEDYSCLVNQP